MSRSLDDLHPKARPAFFELIARAAEAQIPLMVIYTGRTQAEQDALYAQGRTTPGDIVTWTRDSLHVMKPERGGKAIAIDVCPYDVFQLHGDDKLKWNTADPVWAQLGAIGIRAGLKWGVVDSKGERKDLGHFEYMGPLF